jgi:hypothetical protein
MNFRSGDFRHILDVPFTLETPMDKPKMIAVTDPEMAEELSKDPADLSKPFTVKPNGNLWADAEQFEAWREYRNGS